MMIFIGFLLISLAVSRYWYDIPMMFLGLYLVKWGFGL